MQLRDPRAVALEGRSGVVEALARDEVLPEQLFLTLEVDLRELQARLGLRELCAHRVDLGRTARLAQVGEDRLGAGGAIGGLAPLRCLVRLLENEQRVARPHLLAALYRELRELARKGRGDADVLALGVALQRIALRAAARGGEESCEQDARARHRSASTNRFSA